MGWGLGAVRGEIPLFGPGAGSAASAGMTDPWGGCDGVVGRVWRGGGGGYGGSGNGGLGVVGVGAGAELGGEDGLGVCDEFDG